MRKFWLSLTVLGLTIVAIVLVLLSFDFVVQIPQTDISTISINNWMASSEYTSDSLIAQAHSAVLQNTRGFDSSVEYIVFKASCIDTQCSPISMRVEIVTRPTFDYLFGWNADVFGYYSNTSFSFDFVTETVRATTRPERRISLRSPEWQNSTKIDDVLAAVLEEVDSKGDLGGEFVVSLSRGFDNWHILLYDHQDTFHGEMNIDF